MRSVASTAINSKTPRASRRARAKAAAIVAMFCGEQAWILEGTCRAMTSKTIVCSSPCRSCAHANAHAVFARSIGAKASTLATAAVAILSNSAGACASARAKAQAVEERCCGVNSSIWAGAAASIASKRDGASTSALANAQDRLAKSCGPNSKTRYGVSCAMAAKSVVATTPSLARPQATFARLRGVSSPRAMLKTQSPMIFRSPASGSRRFSKNGVNRDPSRWIAVDMLTSLNSSPRDSISASSESAERSAVICLFNRTNSKFRS
mmetsp:Transcript_21114/g.72926  ORF Transcript_21114/g.72926 Transcript_21114/m.72926 type:complete len:266 (+) Transcript_21114:1705-2502(+)